MTLTTLARTVSYAGNGSASVFAVPFKFFDSADLVVTLVVDATGVETVKTEVTHYSVTGEGDDSGGDVTMVTAPASGETLIISRVVPLTQDVDLVGQGRLSLPVIEEALDRLAMADQQAVQVSSAGRIEGIEDGVASDDAATLGQVEALILAAETGDADIAAIPVIATGRTQGRTLAQRFSGKRFNPEDFGDCDLTGASANDTAWTAMEVAREASGGGVIEFEGIHRLDSMHTILGEYVHIVSDASSGSKIIAKNASNPALQIGGAALLRWIKLENVKIQAGVSGYGVPLIRMGASGFSVSRITLEDLRLDLDSSGLYVRTGIEMIEAFEIEATRLDGINWRNGGPFCTVYDPTLTGGNIGFRDSIVRDAGIGWLISANLASPAIINSVEFNNCKQVRASGLAANSFFCGTVAAGGASAGQPVVNVTAGQGVNYVADGWFYAINNSGDLVAIQILSVSTDEITLKANLPFTIPASRPCATGYFHSVLGRNIRAVDYTLPHFEQSNGVIGSGVRMLTAETPINDNNVYREFVGLQDCIGWEARRPVGQAAFGANGIVMDMSVGTGHLRNRVVGPCQFTSGGEPTAVVSGDSVAFVGRGGGWEQEIGPWYQNGTVAINQTAAQLTGPNASATVPYRVRKPGYLYGLRVNATTARAAGTLTATVYLNGSATAITAILNGSSAQDTVTEKQLTTEQIALAKGDRIDVRITTDGTWAPTTNDVTAYPLITQ